MGDSFPPWIAKVRKDPLGATGYNRLTQDRFRWAEEAYAREHILTAGAAIGTAGEHNAPEVPREVGSIYPSAGPAFTKEDFRYATGVTRPALGTASLTLNPLPYSTIYDMAVQVQNCSEAGLGRPCITSHIVISTSAIEFYSQKLNNDLGVGNTWTAEDAPICVAIHGPPLPTGSTLTTGIDKARGNTLTEQATDWNAQVQADADIRAMFLLGHSSAGIHIVREVPRTWASVGVRSAGGVYDLLATSSRLPLTVSRPGLGICRLTTATAWSLSAQPFVTTDFQRINSGAEADTYISVTPRSLITTTTIDVYIYKYNFSTLQWARADTDFFIVIHAGQ